MLREAVRARIRVRHVSRATEKHYLQWIRRLVRFHGMKSPRLIGEGEIEAFLSHLGVKENVTPSTKNEALNGLAFLSKDVLERELGTFTRVRWAKKKINIPVVLTREEAALVLSHVRKGSTFRACRVTNFSLPFSLVLSEGYYL